MIFTENEGSILRKQEDLQRTKIHNTRQYSAWQGEETSGLYTAGGSSYEAATVVLHTKDRKWNSDNITRRARWRNQLLTLRPLIPSWAITAETRLVAVTAHTPVEAGVGCADAVLYPKGASPSVIAIRTEATEVASPVNASGSIFTGVWVAGWGRVFGYSNWFSCCDTRRLLGWHRAALHSCWEFHCRTSLSFCAQNYLAVDSSVL